MGRIVCHRGPNWFLFFYYSIFMVLFSVNQRFGILRMVDNEIRLPFWISFGLCDLGLRPWIGVYIMHTLGSISLKIWLKSVHRAWHQPLFIPTPNSLQVFARLSFRFLARAPRSTTWLAVKSGTTRNQLETEFPRLLQLMNIWLKCAIYIRIVGLLNWFSAFNLIFLILPFYCILIESFWWF